MAESSIIVVYKHKHSIDAICRGSDVGLTLLDRELKSANLYIMYCIISWIMKEMRVGKGGELFKTEAY